ncbi:TetR/AcrR family transcriptional regulator [Cohnella abietis]|uniref:TetR family transcriptional regulator n=1 Tax=Cohnella abietis TaxID=2507935 RepID=A0A3T1D7F7_9BACL|nr:TetR/AcrR family transcriptional regulator [Cohnella abietis]BBI34027.1 TetR family transcriptional regulator [Cohnella abietis]
MRHKDENKSEAIFEATIQLLNEIGFSDISMSKIAKRANVSSATIYVYFENKEDMFGKLYKRVKEKMSQQMIDGLDGTLSTQALCERFMRNSMKFIMNNKDYFFFLEQFATSPLIEKLSLGDTSSMFGPLFEIMEKGKEIGEIKPFDTLVLLTFCYFPITQLARAHYKGQLEANEVNLQQVITMSWDAIRL